MEFDKKNIARHLRQQQTPAEKKLWQILRNRQFENLKFRRQHPLKDYIVDFYCHELELVIELDSEYHNEKEQKYKDEQRDFHLCFLGYKVLRYKNNTVINNFQAILEDIKEIENKALSQRERVGMREKSILSTKNLSSSQKKTLQNANISVTDSDVKKIKTTKNNLPHQRKRARVREKSILSTKIITPEQKKMAQNADISATDYDVKEIKTIKNNLPCQRERARVREKTILSNKKLTPTQKKMPQNTNISVTDDDVKEIKTTKNNLPSQRERARVREKSILSTKKLSSSQKKMLQNANISVTDYNAIEINYIDFESPKKVNNGIFTSQNAVKAFFSQHNRNSSEIEMVFCVGEKTELLLEENGQKVVKMLKTASELAYFIKKTYKNQVFHFFCGNIRRDEIPSTLKNENITLFEVKTYETLLKATKIDQKWDGILFFSPSGVKSFSAQNKFKNSAAFCIGKTTASEVKKHTTKVYGAEKTTIESVIEKAIEILNKT